MLIKILLHCVFFSRHQQLTKLLSRYIKEPLYHMPRESHGKYDCVTFIIYFAIKYRGDDNDNSRSTVALKVLGVCFYVLRVYSLCQDLCLLLPVLYYWTLFFPTLSGAAILLIAAMLGGYGGVICVFLFPWLARSIFTQYHRMTTYQRFVKNMEHVECLSVNQQI